MKITLENWKEVEQDLKASGIQNATYDRNDFIQTVTTKRGIVYEFSPDIIKQLIASGAMEVKLGRRIHDP